MDNNNQQSPRSITFRGLLLAVVYSVLLILLAGGLTLNILQKRIYLQEQLASHGQDSATALGLSLSSGASEGDWVAASLMIDVIFDSGAYLNVRLLDSQNQVVINRSASVKLESVPEWFVRLLPLATPVGEAEIMAGWQSVGIVQITSHPGFAYRDLWATVKQQSLLYLGLGTLAFVLLHLLLKQLLRPLHRLEMAADKIASRQFDVQLPLPLTREMQRVTQAVNIMASSLNKVFSEQLQTIESLRENALVDPVSGLMNRHAFDKRMQANLSSGSGEAVGTLGLLVLKRFTQYNEKFGRPAGDLLLQELGAIIQDEVKAILGSFVARHAGSSYSLFIPKSDLEQITQLIDRILIRVRALEAFGEADNHCQMAIGLVLSKDGDRLSNLLSAADFAAQDAVLQEGGGWAIYKDNQPGRYDNAWGAGKWQQVLREAIDRRGFILNYQPVVAQENRRVMVQQVFARLPGEDGEHPAAVFLPMVERFAMTPELDVHILEQALERLSRHSEDSSFCVLLSAQTLALPNLETVLSTVLQRYQLEAKRLILECPEFALQACWAGVDSLIQLRIRFGFKMAIGRFGTTGLPFGYLKDMPVDVIKIDPGLVRDIDTDDGHQFYLRAIVQIAHSQGSQVIAVGIERQEEWDCLTKIGVDGAMGYHICHPQPEPVHFNIG